MLKLEDFFLICPVGFESSVQEEIRKTQPWILGADSRPSPHLIEIVQERKGGLEVRAPKLEGFQLVHHLKSPVRILWRWKSKKISHVTELKNWLRSLRPQEIYEGPLKLQIHSRQSRLQNEKMIERVFHEDWKNLKEESAQTLYVDLYQDQMTLSWDLCGEPLYKRSWAPYKGQAPLRENLAHLLLQDLTEGFTGPELSQMSLVDPMMGSGTFLWEALSWNWLNTERAFSYQSWKGLPSFFKIEWWKNSLRPRQSLFKHYEGYDQDPHMVEIAQKNATLFEPAELHLEVQDVRQAQPLKTNSERLLISNPPYGERIAGDSVENLIRSSLEAFKPLRALFVWPEGKIPSFLGYRSDLKRKFLHGGIPVQVIVFSRNS